MVAACDTESSSRPDDDGSTGGGGAGGAAALPLGFVSSIALVGNLGGPATADNQCTGMAAAASRAGEYRAYLALAGGEHPWTRFNYRGPWYDASDRLIVDAVDPQDPPDRLENAFVLNEHGDPITITFDVWTGVGSPSETCGDWTQASGDGWVGRVGAADATFASNLTLACNTSARLYCLQENYAP